MQTLALDVKRVARERGAHLPQHPMLSHAILAFTRYWLKLGGGRPPAWADFDMMGAGDALPYLTIFKCSGESSFTIEFTGSAISALAGEDLAGRKVTFIDHAHGDIDWFERVCGAVKKADIQLSTGSTSPAYTSSLDFVAADFPFMDGGGNVVNRVVCLTIPKLN
jgi:hypothetical protein